ncbi:hypothetical protein G3A_15740 [Bacillus sp. 17376]|uniref:DUF58 domain-containing protein n=1 Tax=Mesobacillus boroniphilus JCM 21738 TaxID=1294265 RepID=W4RR02_9BACI|nr:DUF58 domain-containing protein [Mesobacillus boroniphilus]ESU31604.1 hypothetical protein G3A_15740 [Bacillus sp. 17376]GAE46870.1 hypothetical protein JCM21738_3798 [Mesobacillus boroniphilus JCM 21738]
MKKYFQKFKEIWKLIVLLLLILITISYAMFQGGFVSWFLFYSFLPFALYALGLAFYSIKDIKAERVFTKQEYNAGEKFKASIVLERNVGFPLFYAIGEEETGDTLSGNRDLQKAKTMLFPGFSRVFGFDYSIENLPRGEHALKGIKLKTGDPLGLIEKEKILPVENKILVYPAYQDMVYRPIAHHFDQGMTASKERVQRDTSMAIGVREYQPGDRFSWINWKATARRNDIMTKEFEQRQSHDVVMLMDCAPEPRFEVVVSFTASVIRAILRKGAQVGLMTLSTERKAFPARGGEAHQQQLLHHLAKIQDGSPVSFDRVLEAESFLAQQNNSIMLITAQLTKELIEKAAFYNQRNASVSIFLIKNGQESPTQTEKNLRASATARGIRLVMVHDGQFAEAFSEVNRG